MDYGRMPHPFPLETLSGSAQEAAAAVIDVAAREVAAARYTYNGDNGDYILFSSETVNYQSGSDEVALEICRRGGDLITELGDWSRDSYYSVEHGKVDSAVSVNIRPDGLELLDGHVSRMHHLARDIGSGVLAGEHTRGAIRFLDREEDEVPMMVQAMVTRGGNGTEQPLTTVALKLVRPYNERANGIHDMLSQQYDVVYDPNTGVYVAGSAFNSTAGGGSIAFLEAERQQELFQPNLPVDRHLTPDEWVDLVQNLLNPADLLQL